MPPKAPLITPVLIGGCVVILISFAVRASFGIFQIPIADEFGWLRAEFSLAIAIQNLAWGIGQPLFGAFAERFGDRRAIIVGALVYAIGLVLSAYSITPLGLQTWAWLVGFGVAGTGFGVILAVVGRAASDANRSMALGIATAAGSAGQVVGAPIAEFLLVLFTWQTVFLIFAGAILASLLALPLMRAPAPVSRGELEQSMGKALTQAFRDPSFTLIFLGFFSCGYQLAFVTAHFPAMVTEMCGPIDPTGFLAGIGITTTSALGAVAISLIGLANIAGTLAAAWAGNRWSKKNLLAGIYTARTVVAAAFILMPITPGSVLVFSVLMGSLWLATVPLTSGLIAHIYGLRYMGTLYGIVFFSHQLGSFLGVWLGGRLYDIHGDYTFVWWVGIAVGAFSAIVHLPVQERRMNAICRMRVVFDLDGTLIDSAPDIHAAGCAVLAAEGLPPVSAAQSQGFIGNGARVYVERLERAAAGANEAQRTARMQRLFLDHYETAHSLTRIYPGVEAALETLRSRGWRLGICTNKPLAPALTVLAHFGWTDLFEVVIGGDSLAVSKPDPAPLRAAIAGLGGGRVVYVGDSEVDAATARAADTPFALFTEGYRHSPLAAIPHDRAFADWAELPAIATALVA